jgi:hypothetical protein
VNPFCDRKVLTNRNIVIGIVRSVEPHSLSNGSGSRVLVDVRGVRATSRGTGQIFRVDKRYVWCSRDAVSADRTLKLEGVTPFNAIPPSP